MTDGHSETDWLFATTTLSLGSSKPKCLQTLDMRKDTLYLTSVISPDNLATNLLLEQLARITIALKPAEKILVGGTDCNE